MYACRFGHLAAARAMLAAGAALDGVDQDGNTALLIAVAEAHGASPSPSSARAPT